MTVGSGRAADRSFGIFQPYRSKVYCLLINLRSKPLNVRSEPLNVRSERLNGDFVVV